MQIMRKSFATALLALVVLTDCAGAQHTTRMRARLRVKHSHQHMPGDDATSSTLPISSSSSSSAVDGDGAGAGAADGSNLPSSSGGSGSSSGGSGGNTTLPVWEEWPWHVGSEPVHPKDRWPRDGWPSAPYSLAPVEGFVTVNGTGMELDGRPFFFAGTNTFNLAQLDAYTDEEIEGALTLHARNGMRVVRFFAFSNGNNASNIPTYFSIQPVLGQFNEAPLQRLDFILSTGGRLGLRFIMVLGNYEPEYGGMRWWVDEALGEGRPAEEFYVHPRVKQAYKFYIQSLLLRNNTLTGRLYRDDPAVLAWEPMNEPHTSDNFEMRRGLAPGRVVWGWLREMTGFIKGLRPRQLVATGEEGYRTSGKMCQPYFNWINSGEKGADFVANIMLPAVDFATIHVYPDNWQIPVTEFDWVNQNFIADRAALAHAAGKPIIIEEFGMREAYHPSGRDDVIRSLARTANANSFVGTLVWQLWHKPVVYDTDTRYDFSYESSGATAMLEQADYMNAKSMGLVKLDPPAHLSKWPEPCQCVDIMPPGEPFNCSTQFHWGFCGMDWMTAVWPPLCESPGGYCAKTCGRCNCHTAGWGDGDGSVRIIGAPRARGNGSGGSGGSVNIVQPGELVQEEGGGPA